MKPNPLACALLVLLAVAVQLPAQNTNTANAPKWEETQPVSQSVTNATGTNKTSAGDIFDQVAAEQSATNAARTNLSDWEPVSSSSTNAAAAIPDWATNNASASTNSAGTKKTSAGYISVDNPDGSVIKASFDEETSMQLID